MKIGLFRWKKCFISAGSGGGGTSSSKPLTPEERKALYDAAISSIYGSMTGKIPSKTTTTTSTVGPASAGSYGIGGVSGIGNALNPYGSPKNTPQTTTTTEEVTTPGGALKDILPNYHRPDVVDPGAFNDPGAFQGGGVNFAQKAAMDELSKVAGLNGGGGDLAAALKMLQGVQTGPGGLAFNDPGEYKTLTGGDYDALEAAIRATREAPLRQTEKLQREGLDEDLARRQIFSSGLAGELQNDLTEGLAPQYASIGGEAATQRYGLQADEMRALNEWAANRASSANAFNLGSAEMLNNYNLNRSGAANEYGMNRANLLNQSNYNVAGQENAAQWAPLNYLQGLWNQTGGVISNSNQDGGWNFGLL